ncbi:MAG: CSLREA domain-containing protein [Sandaracinaceae bacterium]|nr:CSLREA domain-containing protein [Sandaracinaceae bacterium]
MGLIGALAAPSGALAATITVNTGADELNTDGDCSLREAIAAANGDVAVDACTAGSGADTIEVGATNFVLSRTGSGEDANATGDLDVATEITITGTGFVDGAASDRVLHVAATGILTITGLTIRNGLAVEENGGGILNEGTLTLDGVTLIGNVSLGDDAGANGGGFGARSSTRGR